MNPGSVIGRVSKEQVRKSNNVIIVFRANLMLVNKLGDKAAEGRAYGNLGNTHYLLGNFDKAVQYHEEVNL